MKKGHTKGEELLSYLQKLYQELDDELRFEHKTSKSPDSKLQVEDSSETNLNTKEE